MNKIKLKEAENTTVNDEQLMGLYDAAAKTEGQIINLAVAAMKFSNPEIKRAVTALKSQANQLVNLIATSMENNNGSDLGLQTDTAGMMGANAAPAPIEAPAPAEDMIESTRTNGSSMNIMEAKAKAVAFFMREHKFSIKEAIAMAEKFDPSIFNKKEESKEDAPEEELKEAGFYHNDKVAEEDQLPAPPEELHLDISEACEVIKEGLSIRDFDTFKTSLVEALNTKKFGKKYTTVVANINEAGNIDALNEAIDRLYDYADVNNITIKA